MRTFRERLFSSLVTRLTLAVLAVLVLSLGLTTAVFLTESHVYDKNAAHSILVQEQALVRHQIFTALVSPVSGKPLARVGHLPIDRVLLTQWPDGMVVGDTANGGGPDHPPLYWTVGDQDPARTTGETTFDGVDYVYKVLRVLDLPTQPPTPYRDEVLLERVAPFSARALNLAGQLALAGAVAVIVSLLAALAVLRAITRPLHRMTVASERIAAGDYDQQVTGIASADEVGQLARAFNHMASEVKRVREAQRRFVANVSHDLRSPLTSIIGFSQALTEDEAITPQQRRAAEIVHGEAQRLYRLTMDLLDLSRLEAGRLPLSREPLDLAGTLREVAARYEALPMQHGVRFAASLPGEALPVRGDPDRLTQVLVNLLDNAYKFCNANGAVRLSAARRGGIAVIEVYNTGAGIPPGDLPRVFDRFYRADHSRSQQTGGSGIGLAIVRELVHAHGGEVTATSEPGASTTMIVRLPLATDAVFTKDLHAANTPATGVGV